MKILIIPCIAASLLAGCSGEPMEAPLCPVDPAKEAQPANREGMNPIVWDNGNTTFLSFPGNQPVPPVINVIGLNRKERRANHSTDTATGVVSVHGVYPAIVLRDGERLACLRNKAYDQVGTPLATGGF